MHTFNHAPCGSLVPLLRHSLELHVCGRHAYSPVSHRRNLGALTHKVIQELILWSECQLRVQVSSNETLVVGFLVDEGGAKAKAFVKIDPRFMMRETVGVAGVWRAYSGGRCAGNRVSRCILSPVQKCSADFRMVHRGCRLEW